MSGEIYMGNRHIISTVDPSKETDLSRKKYVDDQDARMRSTCLSLTGGTMTGDINIGNHKLISTYHTPTHETYYNKKICRCKI